MTELPKAYTPADVEGAIYERWLAADVFAPDGAGSTADPALPPFTIIQPPPNITGSLHLGHAQRTAVEDLMIRHARMRGHRTLFLPGLDHASIAAQFVLDGILAKEGESRRVLGRERYLERMRAFMATTREVMLGQQRRVGASADWGRLRYTMDEGSAKAVRVAFERLYRADLAYRTEALVNWCPGCRTSVSDLEVVATPETGTLWTIRYHLIDPATGEPYAGRDHRDRHDPAGDDPRRHRGGGPPGRPALPRRSSAAWSASRSSSATCRSSPTTSWIGPSGPAPSRSRRPTTTTTTRPACATVSRHRRSSPTTRRSPATGTRTTGWTATRRARRSWRTSRRPATWWPPAARDGHRALPALQRRHRAAAQDAVVHPDGAARGTGARGDAQRADPDPARAVREDLGALADQHPRLERLPPAVVGPPHPGLVLPGRPRHGLVRARPARPPARSAAGRAAELPRTPTSSTPGSAPACGRSRRSAGRTTRPIYRRYYPASVMETGYDIIFFWVARMMMLGLELTDASRSTRSTCPASSATRTARRCPRPRATSSTRSAVIDESGADALRFALIHGATPGNDQSFGPAKLEHARNFANKLWNATRFVAGARPGVDPRRTPAAPAGRAPPGPGRALAPVARRGHDRGRRRGHGRLRLRRGHAAPLRGDLERVLRLGPRARQGPPRRRARSAEAREATWWTLVEVARHVPAAAPPGHAVRDRGALGGAAASGDRPRAADRGALARGGGARPAAEARSATLIELVSGIRNARASAKLPAADWLETLVYVPPELGSTFEALRPAVERLARARPLLRELTHEALEAAARPGDLAVIVPGGEVEAAVRPCERRRRRGARSRATRTRAGRGRGMARRRSRAARQRAFVSRLRRRWSRARARANPSWPIRSTGSGTGSGAERARSRRPATRRASTSKVATTGRWSDASPGLDGRSQRSRPQAARQDVVDPTAAPHERAPRIADGRCPTVANASSNAPASARSSGASIGALKSPVRRSTGSAEAVGERGHAPRPGPSLLRAPDVGQVGVDDRRRRAPASSQPPTDRAAWLAVSRTARRA